MTLRTRLSGAVALCFSGLVLLFAWHYGARTAGGADALGYVSESYLLRDGDLRIEDEVSASAHWPFAMESMAPLGFVAGRPRNAIVPSYSPGAPVIMAVAMTVWGDCGPFIVAPLAAFVVVMCTWIFALRITGDPVVAVLATALMAASPVLLVNAPLPMSDTVMAAVVMMIFALLTFESMWAGVAAGLTTALAIGIRPNLAPLGAAWVLAAGIWAPPSARLGRVLAFTICAAIGPALIALYNSTLHGSPFRSGYGSFVHLYALEYVPKNANLYLRWLWESHGLLPIGFAVVPLISRGPRSAWFMLWKVAPLALFAGLLAASYLFYTPFDNWTFLRFFLPGLPLFYLLTAKGLCDAVRLMPRPLSSFALLVLSAYILLSMLGFATRQGMYMVGPGERRYATIASFVARALPENAAFIALQHSGTIALYAGRLTLRYDLLPPHRLGSVLEWLRTNGYRPYLVLEDWEEPRYRSHFTSNDRVSRLDIGPTVQTATDVVVRLYDLTELRDVSAPFQVLNVKTVSECAHPAPNWTEFLKRRDSNASQ